MSDERDEKAMNEDLQTKTILNPIVSPIIQHQVARYQYDEDYSKELEICKKERYQFFKENHVETTYERWILYRKEFEGMYNFIQKCLDDYTVNALNTTQFRLIVTKSWVGRQYEGQGVDPHRHNSVINGCLYFTIPDKSTPIIFNTVNSLNQIDEHSLGVKSGELVLFPNALEHFVPPNTSKETRYVLAFNTAEYEDVEDAIQINSKYNKQISK